MLKFKLNTRDILVPTKEDLLNLESKYCKEAANARRLTHKQLQLRKYLNRGKNRNACLHHKEYLKLKEEYIQLYPHFELETNKYILETERENDMFGEKTIKYIEEFLKENNMEIEI